MLLESGVGMVEEPQTVFESQRAGGSIVDALHADAAFLHKFAENGAVVNFIWFHRHVDACVDGYADGIFLVAGHFFACVEIVDVGPVGDYQTVPLQVVFEPLGQQSPVGMDRSAVD